jgi:hypothetical protein
MMWGIMLQWGVKVVTLVLVGIITLALWHLLDLFLINRKRNLMHVAGPRPLPILGRSAL